jgi:mono/diheme cytochrome c family protein
MNLKFWGAAIAPLFILISFSSHAEIHLDRSQIEKGRKLYLTHCLRCHNKDPNNRGSIGPEIVDAPIEVMYSKIMTGKYPNPLPKNFIPKRKSGAMQANPKLKNDIPAIWAYVQSLKKKK